MGELPNYIQRRVDNNKLRIKEIKTLLLDVEDDTTEEAKALYEELSFTIKENTNLMTANYHVQTYTDIQLERITEGTGVSVEEFLESDHFQEITIIEGEQLSGGMLEAKATEQYGEYLYQVKSTNDTSYVPKSDEEIFKKYGIKFVNGLPTHIDLDNTPYFVLEMIKHLSVTDRLKHSSNGYLGSDAYGSDALLRIYFESEITTQLIDDFKNVDLSDEARGSEFTLTGKFNPKDYVLVQIKPDYQVSGDYRYSFQLKTEKFNENFVKLKDKTKEFGYPTYKMIKKEKTDEFI